MASHGEGDPGGGTRPSQTTEEMETEQAVSSQVPGGPDSGVMGQVPSGPGNGVDGQAPSGPGESLDSHVTDVGTTADRTTAQYDPFMGAPRHPTSLPPPESSQVIVSTDDEMPSLEEAQSVRGSPRSADEISPEMEDRLLAFTSQETAGIRFGDVDPERVSNNSPGLEIVGAEVASSVVGPSPTMDEQGLNTPLNQVVQPDIEHAMAEMQVTVDSCPSGEARSELATASGASTSQAPSQMQSVQPTPSVFPESQRDIRFLNDDGTRSDTPRDISQYVPTYYFKGKERAPLPKATSDPSISEKANQSPTGSKRGVKKNTGGGKGRGKLSPRGSADGSVRVPVTRSASRAAAAERDDAPMEQEQPAPLPIDFVGDSPDDEGWHVVPRTSTRNEGVLKPAIKYTGELQPNWKGKNWLAVGRDWMQIPKEYPLKDTKGEATALGRRVAVAKLDRGRRGSYGYPDLLPCVKAKMNVDELPYTMMTFEDQKTLIKAFALADGRCPVLGCESSTHDTPKAAAAEGGWMRDSGGFLTGAGVEVGYGTRTETTTFGFRPFEYVDHWLAFHMRVDLCFALFCPYDLSNDPKKPSPCDNKVFRTLKSFHDHISAVHAVEAWRDLGPRFGVKYTKRQGKDGKCHVRQTPVAGLGTGGKGLVNRMVRQDLWRKPNPKFLPITPFSGAMEAYFVLLGIKGDPWGDLPFITDHKAVPVFREHWRYVGPASLQMSEDAILAICEKKILERVEKDKVWLWKYKYYCFPKSMKEPTCMPRWWCENPKQRALGVPPEGWTGPQDDHKYVDDGGQKRSKSDRDYEEEMARSDEPGEQMEEGDAPLDVESQEGAVVVVAHPTPEGTIRTIEYKDTIPETANRGSPQRSRSRERRGSSGSGRGGSRSPGVRGGSKAGGKRRDSRSPPPKMSRGAGNIEGSSEREKELAIAHSEVARLRAQVRLLQDSFKDKLAKVARPVGTPQEVVNENENLQAEVQRVTEQLAEREGDDAALRAMENELDKSMASQYAWKVQVNELNEALAVKVAEFSDLELKYSNQEEYANQMEYQVANLEGRLKVAESDSKGDKTKAGLLIQEVDALRHENVELQKNREFLRTDLASACKANSELNEKVRQMESQVDALEDSLSKATVASNKAKAKYSNLWDQFKALEAKNSKLQKEVETTPGRGVRSDVSEAELTKVREQAEARITAMARERDGALARARDAQQHGARLERVVASMREVEAPTPGGEGARSHHCPEGPCYTAVSVDCKWGVTQSYLRRINPSGEVPTLATRTSFGERVDAFRDLVTSDIRAWRKAWAEDVDARRTKMTFERPDEGDVFPFLNPMPQDLEPNMSNWLNAIRRLVRELMSMSAQGSWELLEERAPEICKAELASRGGVGKPRTRQSSKASSEPGRVDDAAYELETEDLGDVTAGSRYSIGRASSVATDASSIEERLNVIENTVRTQSCDLMSEIQNLAGRVQDLVLGGAAEGGGAVMDALGAIRGDLAQVRRDQLDRIESEVDLITGTREVGEKVSYNPDTGREVRNAANLRAFGTRPSDARVLIPCSRRGMDHGRRFMLEMQQNLRHTLDLDVEAQTSMVNWDSGDSEISGFLSPRQKQMMAQYGKRGGDGPQVTEPERATRPLPGLQVSRERAMEVDSCPMQKEPSRPVVVTPADITASGSLPLKVEPETRVKVERAVPSGSMDDDAYVTISSEDSDDGTTEAPKAESTPRKGASLSEVVTKDTSSSSDGNAESAGTSVKKKKKKRKGKGSP